MGRRKKTKDGFLLGWTPLLYSVEIVFIDGKGRQEKGWQEAYGYLGSYHKTFDAAMSEVRWLTRTYPDKYTHWAIQQVVLDENDFQQYDHEQHDVIVAHSDGAPLETDDDTATPGSGESTL